MTLHVCMTSYIAIGDATQAGQGARAARQRRARRGRAGRRICGADQAARPRRRPPAAPHVRASRSTTDLYRFVRRCVGGAVRHAVVFGVVGFLRPPLRLLTARSFQCTPDPAARVRVGRKRRTRNCSPRLRGWRRRRLRASPSPRRLAARWAGEGREWVVFFQDTNGLAFRQVPRAATSCARNMYRRVCHIKCE